VVGATLTAYRLTPVSTSTAPQAITMPPACSASLTNGCTPKAISSPAGRLVATASWSPLILPRILAL
jgi:hypothetical protein